MKRRDFLGLTTLSTATLATARLHATFAPGGMQRRGAPKRVIVVGAGLAGLSAAYELTRSGHDVTVLEARTRPGGRVLTLRDPFPDGLYADAGATRVPNHHHFTIKYAELFGLTLDPFAPRDVPAVYHVRGHRLRVASEQNVDWPYDLTAEERTLGVDGMRQKYVWSMLDEIGDVTDPAWPSREMLEKYDQMNRSDFWRSRGASSEAVALLSLGGIDDRLETWSTLFMLRNQALNRKRTHYFKIRGGTDLLPKAFASRLSEKIRYGVPVVKIEQQTRGVKATFRQADAYHTVTGDYLICAVPFSVQKNIEVAPAFSVEKQQAIEQLPYFSASKIFLPGARGILQNHFEGGVTKCWDEDEWARGVSAYYKPGQFGSLWPHVARPEGRIHFAGEHTSVWIDGWMQGALESGNRVAREINAL